MNLKIAMAFILYWGVMALFFSFGSGFLGDATTDIQTPDGSNFSAASNYTGAESGYSAGSSDLSSSQYTTIQKVVKTLGFVFFGLGLPTGTPAFFAVIMFVWQTGVTILGILLIADAIHAG